MKTAFRLLLLVVVVVTGVITSGVLMAQSDHRITPPDSPIALWCTGDGNKTIMAYRFDKDGTSHFAWRYTPGVTPVVMATPEVTATTTARRSTRATPEPTVVASAPTNSVLIEQEGVSLKLENDGRLSVSTVQWDGKVFVLFFHGCPDPGELSASVIDNGVWSDFRMN